MKKLLALILVCIMAVPLGILAATPVSAAGKTVYVSDAGDDTAAGTDAAPVKTLDKAYELIGNEGTIAIKGTYTQEANYMAPKHTGKVTIKGADSSSVFKNSGGQRFFIGGVTEFTDLKMDFTAKLWMLICSYNDCTISETVTVDSGANVTYLLAGAPDGGAIENDPKPVTFTINGGTWGEVIGLIRGGTNSVDGFLTAEDYKDCDMTFNIGKNASINKLAAYTRNYDDALIIDAACTINLNGGKIGSWIGASCSRTSDNHGYGKGMTINMSKNFDLAGSFKATEAAGVFNGINGDSVWRDTQDKTYGKLGKTTLVLDAEIYEANKNNELFRGVTVQKASAVTPPSAQTGDALWVAAAIAAVSVVGFTLAISKKKA